jgi:hypothetical protein
MKLPKTCPIRFNLYNKPTKTCSRKCSAIFHTGENNPNYGKKWNDEMKLKQSVIVKSKVDDEYRLKAGSANRGVKFTKDRIDSMHKHRDSSSYSRPHTEYSKNLIGIKSKQKYTKGYIDNNRKLRVNRGYWVSDNDRNDYDFYVILTEWVKPMWDLCESDLLSSIGIFNSITNINGLVRDHKVSRKFGFDNGVFPEIMRHPMNCDIITHSQNSSKREKCTLSISELFDNIESYSGQWDENDLALIAINNWRIGKRFSADKYRRD